MLNIKIVRLNSGEELLCSYEKLNEQSVKLSEIALLIPTRENSIGLMPFMPYTNSEELTVKESFVAFIAEPVEGLRQQYQQMFGKIITQSSQIVV